MKKLFLTFLISAALLFVTGCANQNLTTYSYADGSGNEYIINETTLEYIPLEPALSSTGDYDGGEYAEIEIDESEYLSITSLLDGSISNESIHIENRVKMSGWIEIEQNNKIITSVIIEPDSEAQLQIEELLQNLLNN
tara:strand:+ start:161 stop:574 length:414 start_codon:yes stop_codon:yes gene_type:complete